MTSKDLISKLNLQPHPEGGYYRETYRSEQTLIVAEEKNRNVSTAIYYMLEDNDRSRFHRIQSDELWFFHQGDPLEIVFLKDGKAHTIVLGNDVAKGELPQAKIEAHLWFGSRIKGGSGYSLVSCTVAPGFDFSDFEMADKALLQHQYPHLKEVIEQFT
jgi:predicted cupin superfamily sugar epimerase